MITPLGTRHIILVGDGMADYPIEALGGKSPLEVAKTPNMDRIAACRIGLVKTIPDGMEPGSDIANLSLLGYDPKTYHTGRAPLEAASMGIQLTPRHVAYRMNLVTLDKRSEDEVIMISHSSGDISTTEASEIVEDLKQEFKAPDISIHAGVAYRHLFVWEEGPDEVATIPPHDVLEQNMAPYLNNTTGNPVPRLIRKSWQLLDAHPVNLERKNRGLKMANSIWLWGQGKPPQMPTFEERYGLRGGVISAVDLLKGIGFYAGFIPIHVEGATGYIDTNYVGKAEAALEGLKELQFIFLHVEAPDEAGHHGDYEEKIKAIEYFDERVVGTVLEGLRQFDDYRIMVVSDHLTPVAKRTHTEEPTPFAWASRDELESQPAGGAFSEKHAIAGGTILDSGEALMQSFLNRA